MKADKEYQDALKIVKAAEQKACEEVAEKFEQIKQLVEEIVHLSETFELDISVPWEVREGLSNFNTDWNSSNC